MINIVDEPANEEIPQVLEPFSQFFSVYQKTRDDTNHINHKCIPGFRYAVEVRDDGKIVFFPTRFSSDMIVFDQITLIRMVQNGINTRMNYVAEELAYDIQAYFSNKGVSSRVSIDSKIDNALAKGMFTIKINILTFKRYLYLFKVHKKSQDFYVGYGKHKIYISTTNSVDGIHGVCDDAANVNNIIRRLLDLQ
jgi:hypothetical protein